MKEKIEKLLEGKGLTSDEAEDVVQQILQFDIDEFSKNEKIRQLAFQIPALLMLLRTKGESVEEAQGFIRGMRKAAAHRVKCDGMVVADIVGTGGDGAHTVNISTGSSIVAASCGLRVAKQGNRSVSSLCGSADVLEEIGIKLSIDPADSERCLREVGITFCFSPQFHPAMARVRPIRKLLGVPTIFNFLGPMLNPAEVSHLMIGVYKPRLMPIIAGILREMKVKRSLVFHCAGTDELVPIERANGLEVNGDEICEWTLDPKDVDLPLRTIDDLRGGDAKKNAELLINALSGQPGAFGDTLALNAGVALWLAGLHPSIKEGVQAAQESLKKGSPRALLDRWVTFSASL